MKRVDFKSVQDLVHNGLEIKVMLLLLSLFNCHCLLEDTSPPEYMLFLLSVTAAPATFRCL